MQRWHDPCQDGFEPDKKEGCTEVMIMNEQGASNFEWECLGRVDSIDRDLAAAFFILCYPGEIDETALDSLRFATSLPFDYLSFTLPYPLHGTALFERVKRKIKKEWVSPGGFISDHVLIYDAEFSETKMKFAIMKGQVQFGLRKILGNYAFFAVKPFESLTDKIFREIK